MRVRYTEQLYYTIILQQLYYKIIQEIRKQSTIR